ncbi:MAG: response regulator transcription factor [Acidimicrobiales bacterium]|nr:response regulator transcription factor [Acidimicrobiales bacterium]MBO0887190.1 response regulator transcription factor [Acidimicrobiales bacterium]
MARILIVSDEARLRDEVRAVLGPDDQVVEVSEGAAVRAAARAQPIDLVVVDLQVGNMGGMAVCLDLRLEESGGRLPHVPLLMLLDRRADVFLARRSGAEGFVIKPLDPIRLRRAIRAVLSGEPYHDRSYEPAPVLVERESAPPAASAPA